MMKYLRLAPWCICLVMVTDDFIAIALNGFYTDVLSFLIFLLTVYFSSKSATMHLTAQLAAC